MNNDGFVSNAPTPLSEERHEDMMHPFGTTPTRNLETPQGSLGTKEMTSDDEGPTWNAALQRSPFFPRRKLLSGGVSVTVNDEDKKAVQATCADCARGGAPCLQHLPPESLDLTLAKDGEGGTYFATSAAKETHRSLLEGDIVGVFKPVLEEIGCEDNPRGNADGCRVEGFQPGSGAAREVAAYRLDHVHRANVPETVLMTIPGKGLGSMQRFVPNLYQSWNMSGETRSKLGIADVQYLALFDMRVLNTDRHGGNILVNPSTGELWAIDHSYILPPRFIDPEWEWITWPESKFRIDPRVALFYRTLNDAEDLKVLRGLGIEEEACDLFQASSTALKLLLSLPATLTLRRIAEFFRRTSLTFPSPFEECVAESRGPLDDGAKIDFEALNSLLRARIDQFVRE